MSKQITTKHQMLVDYLLEQIKAGEFRSGDALPSEPELAQRLGVSYMTLRKAVSHLVDEGILFRVRGRGTFVVDEPTGIRKPSLGLLLLRNWHSIDPFYFPALVSGFVQRAEEQGFQVHLADRSEPLLETLRFKELRVKACACVLLEKEDAEDADALLNHGVFVVAINDYGGLRRVTSVSPDNRGGAKAATRMIIDLGHRDIAFLTGPVYNLDAAERRKGFEEAVADAGGAVRGSIIPGAFLEETGYEVGKQLVAERRLPTAIIAASDLPAIGCMKALQDRGYRVPQDVSIVGFGDFRLSAYVNPSLTTVRLPLAEIGQQAADALIDVQFGAKTTSYRLECPLVLRDSIAPPAH